MSHRRTFIRTMAGAAAGMFAIGRGVLDVSAQGRGGGVAGAGRDRDWWSSRPPARCNAVSCKWEDVASA